MADGAGPNPEAKRRTFVCERCGLVLPVTKQQPVEVGAHFAAGDFDLWCASCVELDL